MLSVICYLLSFISHLLSDICYRSSVNCHLLSVIHRLPSVICYRSARKTCPSLAQYTCWKTYKAACVCVCAKGFSWFRPEPARSVESRVRWSLRTTVPPVAVSAAGKALKLNSGSFLAINNRKSLCLQFKTVCKWINLSTLEPYLRVIMTHLYCT